MNKFFIHKQSLNTRYLFQEAGPDRATAQPEANTTPVESASAFITRHNLETNQAISAIPVDPLVKDLCHDKISELIAQASNPEYAESQGQIENEINNVLNQGEEAQTLNPIEGGGQNPQPVEAQREAIQVAMASYLNQVQTALEQQAQLATQEAVASEDPAKEQFANNLTQRASIMGAVANSVEQSGIDWQNPVPFGGNSAMVGTAEGTIGTQEGSEADALVGLDTASIPWCGAYVKAMCEQSGSPLPEGPNWNVAETYVAQPSAAGQHVAIYCGGGEMIGGNQGNAVTKCPIPGNYRFNTVANLQQGIHADLRASGGEPQPGDIIVTSRDAGNSDPNRTGPQ
jgi:hypothetical protein